MKKGAIHGRREKPITTKVVIGESEQGSPILYQDHDYNISSKSVNDSFPGSEELYLVVETDTKGGIKHPEVLLALADLEKHMLLDPELGGAKGIHGLVRQVNRLLHNVDPRWSQIPAGVMVFKPKSISAGYKVEDGVSHA